MPMTEIAIMLASATAVVAAPPTGLAAWKDAVDTIQGIVTIAGLLLGAVWAYFKVVKGRVYISRLEPTAGGRLIADPAHPYLVMRLSVKNVGLSRVYVNRDLSTVEMKAFTADDYFPAFHQPDMTKLGVIPALPDHQWIEPGECVVEERIVALPPGALAVTLRFRLLEQRRGGVEWNAVAVLLPEGLSSPGKETIDGRAAGTATAATTTAAEPE